MISSNSSCCYALLYMLENLILAQKHAYKTYRPFSGVHLNEACISLERHKVMDILKRILGLYVI